MVEVLLGTVGGGQVAEAVVVEVEGDQGGVELGCELAGEGGFAGAGTACNAEDQVWRKAELLSWLLHRDALSLLARETIHNACFGAPDETASTAELD